MSCQLYVELKIVFIVLFICLLQKSELTANLDMASHFVSRHLVAGDLDSIALKTFGQVTTLQGINATITELQVHTVGSRDIQLHSLTESHFDQ